MKVVQIVTQMEPGGAQRVASLLADAFAERGLEQELWFLYPKRSAYEHLPFVRILADEPPRSAAHYWRIIKRLIREVRRSQADVLITHTYYANVLGNLAGIAAGVPRRIAVQHSPIETYPRVVRWLDRLLGTVGVYTSNVAVSDTVVRSLAGYPLSYVRNTTRIHNGVDLAPRHLARTEARARFGLPQDRPILLMVGRLARVKNHETAIRALEHIPDAHLAIVGDGERRADLMALVAELSLAARVHFLGEHPSSEMASLYACSDAFVFPSFSEAMPMALAEAMIAGVPIIASDIAANRELLSDELGNVAGLLRDPSDHARLADAIRDVLISEPLRKTLKETARSRVAAFSVEQMADNYLRVINV